jgi:hypothetical protein
MAFAIKITNSPGHDGEYTGGATLAEARRNAWTFLQYVRPGARVRIVRFVNDPRYPDGRVVTVEEVTESSPRSPRSRSARDRTQPRGPRRGRGQRTIHWEETEREGEPWVSFYVRGPGALGWAKSHGSILGSNWEGADGGDFAWTMVPAERGWYEEARKEYPNVRFSQIEYSPPRSWIQSRDPLRRDPTTIVIHGRTYRIEPFVSSRGESNYRLIGVRGARYFTMRNVNRPENLFVISEAPRTNVLEGVWLTDKDGGLRVLTSRRDPRSKRGVGRNSYKRDTY